MSRTIPIHLQQELDRPLQRTTVCVRIQFKDGRVFGFTMLDRDVAYDHLDGFGEVTYRASEGIDPSTVARILGVAPGTVASRLSRARSAMRRMLTEEDR